MGFGLVCQEMQLNCKKAGAKLKEAMCTLTHTVLQFSVCKGHRDCLTRQQSTCQPWECEGCIHPGSLPLHFSLIPFLNSIDQETPREGSFLTLLVTGFGLGNSCIQGQRKSSCCFTTSFSPSQPIHAVRSSVHTPSMHFQAAASPILWLNIPLGLLELGCELAGHPLEMLTSASLRLPFRFLPALSPATETSSLPVVLM